MKKALQYLVIHCTATPGGARGVGRRHPAVAHLPPSEGGRGWKQVGYTDLIHLDGTVERLVGNNEDAFVDPWEITNGAVGYNGVSRHIVYAGGVAPDGRTPKDTRTHAQREALARYVIDFHAAHPGVRIVRPPRPSVRP